ncbi:hypothetical protein Adt_27853 [Abeliophyllum distichum]|uniref:Uncharacterized protein n=1 Tax=Abeliophyllum distichum TaxID=126358 RepID=A0ABD1RUW6_9LAMI
MSRRKSASVNANAYSHNENGKDPKKNDCVDDNSFSIGTEASKFDMAGVARNLKEDARRKHHKKKVTEYYWSPIHHFVDDFKVLFLGYLSVQCLRFWLNMISTNELC